MWAYEQTKELSRESTTHSRGSIRTITPLQASSFLQLSYTVTHRLTVTRADGSWAEHGEKQETHCFKLYVLMFLYVFVCQYKYTHCTLYRQADFYRNMCVSACMHTKSLQPCPTLCDPMDSSPPGSSVHGIFQTRILQWVAMPRDRTYAFRLLHWQADSLPLTPPGKSLRHIHTYMHTMAMETFGAVGQSQRDIN